MCDIYMGIYVYIYIYMEGALAMTLEAFTSLILQQVQTHLLIFVIGLTLG